MDVRRRCVIREALKNVFALTLLMAFGVGFGFLLHCADSRNSPVPDPLAVRYRWFAGLSQECAVRKVPEGPILPCTQFSRAELTGMRTEWHEPE
jgi:hypothetical protein